MRDKTNVAIWGLGYEQGILDSYCHVEQRIGDHESAIWVDRCITEGVRKICCHDGTTCVCLLGILLKVTGMQSIKHRGMCSNQLAS